MWKEGSKQGRNNDRSKSRGNLGKRKPERAGSKSTKPNRADKPKDLGQQITKNELSAGVVISDFKKLLHACETHPLLKVSNTPVRFHKHLTLRDIGVRVKGPQEDTIYAGNKGIHLNVRRGNSFLVFKDNHNVICARKGLRKFYDLYPEYLEFNLGTLPNLEGKIGNKSIPENKSIHHKIFGDLKELFDSNAGGVVIYETNKANGENCQISWVPEVGSWAIASKNVCMMLRTIEDLDLYIGDRYHFAEIIAREWFAQLKKFKEDRIDAIKECLRDFTIVGEYVGNPNYQHLVKYEKAGFLFYLLVHKHTSEEALTPRESFEKITALGLQSVRHVEHPICKSWPDLNNKLRDLYKDVKESSIEAREEGVVLYLVRKYNSGKEDLVSLCKLKTLEYQIYRKLREKLRAFGDKKVPRADLETNFQEQVKHLVGDSKTPQELTFYSGVAKLAFDFAEKGEEFYHLIFGQYVSFLSIMVYCHVNDVPFSWGFFEKSAVQELHSTPWSRYVELKKKLKVNDNYVVKTPRTIVFIPLTIPGIGKTYLFREVVRPYCEDNGLAVRSVSSDALRRSEMDALKEKEPSLSENQLFARTREQADEGFNRLLMHYLKERTLEDKVILIDKNHPPNAIRKTIDLINAHKPRFADVRILAILPKTKPGPTLTIGEKEVTYPLSLELLLSCLVTVQTRKTHETLPGNGVDSAGIVLMFYNMFRDFKFDGPVLKEYGFNGGCSIDFFGENFTFNKEVLDKTTEILSKLHKTGDRPKDIHLLDQLMGLLQDHFFNNHVNRPNKEIQSKSIATVLKNLPVERPPAPPSILTRAHAVTHGKKAEEVVAPKPVPQPYERFWAEATKDNATRAKTYETNPPGSAIAKKEYKPKKIPQYLGVFSKGDEKNRILNLLRYTVAKIQATSSDSLVNEDLAEFTQEALTTWKWPDGAFHVTTCWVGGDKANTTSEAYKTFEEGVSFPFRMKHIVYVPGKIICGIVYLNNELIKVSNRFPHVTLALKNVPAKLSNDVLEALFGGVFYPRYKEGLKFGGDKVSSLVVTLNGEVNTAHLFELPQDIYFDAETKAFTG